MPPTLEPPRRPEPDPDGTELMASLRQRISSGGAPADPRAEIYRPALSALDALVQWRRDSGASLQELDRLERCQRDLQALARGL